MSLAFSILLLVGCGDDSAVPDEDLIVFPCIGSQAHTTEFSVFLISFIILGKIDEILSVPNLTGVYIGPADMSSSYGLKPKFDVYLYQSTQIFNFPD